MQNNPSRDRQVKTHLDDFIANKYKEFTTQTPNSVSFKVENVWLFPPTKEQLALVEQFKNQTSSREMLTAPA